MTRPLALIEGDLALPDARLLSSLPPPFGLRPQPARSTAQRDAERVAAAAAQEAIRTAARHKTPVRRKPLPPGTMFRFFYKVRTPRDYSAHIQAQLDEARYYLEAGKTLVRSSRRDYVLGAGIFAATGIALAWLLTTTAMRDAEKADATLIARPAVVHSEETALQAEAVVKVAPTVVQNAASMAKPVPLAVRPVESKPSRQAALPVELAASSRHTGSYKITRTLASDAATRRASASVNASIGTRPSAPSLHLGKTPIDDRLTLSRSADPSAQASTSAQPEWTARVPSTDAAPEQAALLNWAAQQRRTSAVAASTTITPAHASATPADVTWNARMTQRRVTDNPGAFSANTSQR
ncbi:hypothetical protein ABH945_004362 [Paraburkholderia sp. GAS333]|uniref:hypothetical protein n=1 Tax=Paraburkholderia sp. GAS333 TaxID=3156279 RepID=UPI003D241B3D